MRSRLPGMPRSTRSHRPSRFDRYSANAHGTPLATSKSAESISWTCRCGAVELPVWPTRPITSPVRSYEEHVARALLSEGFRDAATAMLFVKELAVRVEEPALAPAVVR